MKPSLRWLRRTCFLVLAGAGTLICSGEGHSQSRVSRPYSAHRGGTYQSENGRAPTGPVHVIRQPLPAWQQPPFYARRGMPVHWDGPNDTADGPVMEGDNAPAEDIAPGREGGGPNSRLHPQPMDQEPYFGPQMEGPYYEGDGPPWGPEPYGEACCDHEGPCGPECETYGYAFEGPCGPDCPGCGRPWCPAFRWRWLLGALLREAAISVGPHAFKNPLDQGLNGNFGFHETVNLSGPLPYHPEFGWQVGANFVQSNFLGDQVTGVVGSSRNQTFLTAGLFHRPCGNRGLQFGVVFDYLQDLYYVDSRVNQLRAELSYITWCGHELGFWGAFNTKSDTQLINQQPQEISTTDLYVGFYRYNMPNGCYGRFWGGGTGNGDGILGGDYRVVLSNRFDLTGMFNYLIPEEGKSRGGLAQESWGLSINVVWYPFRSRCGQHNGPYRALFPVADNGVMMLDLPGN